MTKEKGPEILYQNQNIQEDIWSRINQAQANKPKVLEVLGTDFNLEKNNGKVEELISQATFEEIVVFLRKIEGFPKKHTLPQWLIEGVYEKFISGWEKLPEAEKNTLDGDDVMAVAITASHHYGQFKYKKPTDLSITDKFFSSFVKLMEKYPAASLDYWKMLSYGADSIRSDILIKGLADIADNEKINSLSKGEVLYNFGRLYSQGNRRETIDKGIDQSLDFEDRKNYPETIKVVKFLKKFCASAEYLPNEVIESKNYIIVSGESEAKEVDDGIQNILLKKLKQGKGSYILNLYTKDTLAKMEERKDVSERKKRLKISENHNQVPFSLAPNIQGSYDGDVLQIADKRKGQNYRPIDVSDLKMINNNEKTQSQKDKSLTADFTFFNTSEIKKIIRKDFGLNLSELSLPEQANFLDFLYDRTDVQVEEVRDFTKIYGVNGFKTFLSLELGGRKMGRQYCYWVRNWSLLWQKKYLPSMHE